MELFNSFATIINSFIPSSAYVLPKPAFPQEYFPPKINPLKSKRDLLGLTEFSNLSRRDRQDIEEFVRFRYEARISNYPSSNQYDLINDLVKNIEVPQGRKHRYLTRELVHKIISS